VRVDIYSYRFAKEILEHPEHRAAWDELLGVLQGAPLFIYPGKSTRNPNLDVVQQLMNVWFERKLAVERDWLFHPLATRIAGSGLAADFRKTFGNLTIQVEVQFGNMSRWYSDVFKFQTAYGQNLINIGVCVVPVFSLSRRIDSNVVNLERTKRNCRQQSCR